MSLKELTQKHHDRAEGSEFAQMLISGDIDPVLYHDYLVAQFLCYSVLERYVQLPDHLQDVFRAEHISADIKELEDQYKIKRPDDTCKSAVDYMNHIESISDDNNKLLAHLYVRHFGDMYGGQMIKKKVPGSGKMYEFSNRAEMIKSLRQLLNDDMVDEARICFDYSAMIFDELVERWRNPKLDLF